MTQGLFLIAIYAVLAGSPMIILVVFLQGSQSSFLYEVARCLALTGVAVLGLQTALVARIGPLERPFGMDVLSRFHRAMGVFAAALVLPHPFLLMAGEGPYSSVLKGLMVPWNIWLGRVTWLLLAWHIGSSIFSRRLGLTFEQWRLLHAVMAPVLFLAAWIHSSRTGTDLSFEPLYWLWVVLLAIFFSGYLSHKVLKPGRRPYMVSRVRQETGNVWTVRLKPMDGKPITPYRAGQFHFVTFIRAGFPTEEHHWTISSSPTQKEMISSTIKESGDFTRTIGKTQPGDAAIVQGPFGRFSYLFHPGDRDLVFIAGGIGITPFRGMLRHMRDTKAHLSVLLIYANRTEADIVFREELAKMEAAGVPKLKVVHVISAPGQRWKGEQGRIDRDLIVRATSGRVEGRSYYLCCPPPMTEHLIEVLLDLGVSYTNIRTEFFSL